MSAEPKPTSTVTLRGVEFDALTEAGCVQKVLDELDEGRGGWIVTPNLHILRRCTRFELDRRLVETASVVVADGMPLLWAAKILGTPLPQRVAGSNLISSLSAGAARRGRSLYLLGGSPGSAEAARDVLIERDPELVVKGTYCPDFGFEKDQKAIEAISDALAEAKADIVFVALSFPKGEILTDKLRTEFPNTWFIGVGISFSFLCGDVKRAPKWMQNCGLEWAHRVGQEPKRLAGRYLVEGVPFAGSLLLGSVWQRLRGR